MRRSRTRDATRLADRRLGDAQRAALQREQAVRGNVFEVLADDEVAGFVIEHPDEGVVSAALGSCGVRAPSPANVSGAHGRVFNISTEPAHRRCG